MIIKTKKKVDLPWIYSLKKLEIEYNNQISDLNTKKILFRNFVNERKQHIYIKEFKYSLLKRSCSKCFITPVIRHVFAKVEKMKMGYYCRTFI